MSGNILICNSDPQGCGPKQSAWNGSLKPRTLFALATRNMGAIFPFCGNYIADERPTHIYIHGDGGSQAGSVMIGITCQCCVDGKPILEEEEEEEMSLYSIC